MVVLTAAAEVVLMATGAAAADDDVVPAAAVAAVALLPAHTGTNTFDLRWRLPTTLDPVADEAGRSSEECW